MPNIYITPFHPKHQSDIDQLMSTIAHEFPTNIFSPTSKKIIELASLPTHKYWVALHNNNAIGTIGLITLSNKSITLKSMFISPDFRGSGLGQLLLNTLSTWCQKNNYTHIYLGTLPQFKSAQKFYKKHQFTIIPSSQLPIDFPKNPLDTIFYQKTLNSLNKPQ